MRNNNPPSEPRRVRKAIAFVFAVVVANGANLSSATDYSFVEDMTGDVLAILATDGTSPFDDSNVVSLTFTLAGDAAFGFGVGEYGGVFAMDSTSLFENDGSGGLRGTNGFAVMVDRMPPQTSHPLGPFFDMRLIAGNNDQMSANHQSGRVGAGGDWLIVPEPAIAILLTAMFTVSILLRPCFGVTRRRR